VKNATMLKAGIVSMIFLVCATTIVRPQDLAKVSPKLATVVLENDRVRVLRLIYKPGEKVPLHSHPAVVVIYMTPCKSSFKSTDNESGEHDLAAGTVRWSPGTTHINENTGKTVCEVTLVELKK
jgi:quercetin dioxygenase-like cupin family protein